MAKATIQSVMEQSDKLHGRWMRDFAGKPRHTRDLDELEKLIEKSSVLLKKAKGLPGEKGDQVEKTVAERLKLYQNERTAIAEAKFVRPEVAEIHALAQTVERAFAVWRRHYGGKDRRTRDLPLLERTIERLDAAVKRLNELADQPEVKKDQLPTIISQHEVMKDERGEIEKLRKSLVPAQQPVHLLAEAQAKIDRYRIHYAGQPRLSCSLALMDTLIADLERVTSELKTIRSSFGTPAEGTPEAQLKPQLDQNLTIVEQHLAGFKRERTLIDEAASKATPREFTTSLGAAANQIFKTWDQHFAGQNRTTRDVKLLSDMCDRLTDIAEQMTALDARTEEPINRRNLGLVDERLRLFESEWVEIVKAKNAAEEQAALGALPMQFAPEISFAPEIDVDSKG
jgi:hypothetical protein